MMTIPPKTVLEESGSVIWINVGDIAVRVLRTDEGVVCDMYNRKFDHLDEAHLAACWALFNETEEGGPGKWSNVEAGKYHGEFGDGN